MRFKLTFSRNTDLDYLTIDYQYYISAWIYKVIGHGNHEFSDFLHTVGWGDGYKKFKLFCYSPLNFGKPKLLKEKSLFQIQQQELSLQVSFQIPEAAEQFIIGLFNNQQAFVGNQTNGIHLRVKQVERLPDPALAETIIYKALSPIVVSYKGENTYAQYLAPTDTNYDELLKQNLINKYQSIPGIENLSDDFNFVFKQLGEPKSKLIMIKPDTLEQSKVRGYLFDFSLTCPVVIHQLIASAGIGEKNSMGFGWVEIIKP